MCNVIWNITQSCICFCQSEVSVNQASPENPVRFPDKDIVAVVEYPKIGLFPGFPLDYDEKTSEYTLTFNHKDQQPADVQMLLRTVFFLELEHAGISPVAIDSNWTSILNKFNKRTKDSKMNGPH